MTSNGELTLSPDGDLALVFSRRLAAAPERVWRAVTDPTEMKAWFPCSVEGDRVVGAEVRFVFDGSSEPQDVGEVVSWSPPTSWSFDWGGHLVTIAVSPAADDDGGSLLTFTQSLPDRSGAARQGAGWHTCLDALDAHLGGGASSSGGDDWQPRYTDYLQRMGPSVAAVVERRPTLRWERTHFVDAARVWRALTDPDEWSSWMCHGVTMPSLAVGGRVTFDFGPEHGTMDSVIVGLEEGRRFAYTFGDASITEWVVRPEEDGCSYTLTHHNAEPGTAGGWHHHLITLDMFLASGQVVPQDPAMSHALYGEAEEPVARGAASKEA